MCSLNESSKAIYHSKELIDLIDRTMRDLGSCPLIIHCGATPVCKSFSFTGSDGGL